MTIFTGLQATGSLHIGNYLGAIKPMIHKSQNLGDGDNLYLFVPDLHSLTIDLDYEKFSKDILDNVKVYLAAGLDASKTNTNVFRQSRVPAHSQMQWLLSCFSYFGELKKMTQFKDKSSDNSQNINTGLFMYPVLMVGDILLYDSKYVPLGKDQMQHLELTRNIAIRINNKFQKEVFVVPEDTSKQLEFVQTDEPLKIRSLTKPEKKMSKSSPEVNSKILLNDSPESARKKIMKATTDQVGVINWDWENQPGITNLLQLYSACGGASKKETIQKWTGQTRYGDLKTAVADIVCDFLKYFQEDYNKVSDEAVIRSLEKGEEIANKTANTTLQRFEKELGLR